MITKTLVKSFYNSLLVTCYEQDGIKYVTNQHGNYDVYESEYIRGNKTKTVDAGSEEIQSIIREFKKQGGENNK
ncbi:MAG: hypothetical protein EPN22_09255 [Nitrospirae bacterium]|nr:MAG: hypothetical protein EPN22_09255 [Nitrospirota bacterium]